MARPREFDADEALACALDVFWRKGYQGASLADLLSASGLSKSSFYEAFGSKRALFIKALETYSREHIRWMSASLENEIEAHGSAVTFLGRMHKRISSGQAGGCMACNEAIELAAHDPKVRKLVEYDFQGVEDAFYASVKKSQAAGEMISDISPRRLARFLTTVMQGLHVVSRSRTDAARSAETIAVLKTLLEAPSRKRRAPARGVRKRTPRKLNGPGEASRRPAP